MMASVKQLLGHRLEGKDMTANIHGMEEKYIETQAILDN